MTNYTGAKYDQGDQTLYEVAFYGSDGAAVGVGWTTNGPAAAAAAPAPAPPPAFNQTQPNTIGSTIMMAYGTGRLGGQAIWTTGIEASPDATQTGLVTGMWAFCEPADPDEPIRIQKLWANGTPFYDYSVSPASALSVANLPPDAQDILDACVANMVLHTGGPGEQPDDTMSAILGAANVPANRGLRTITFIEFPTLVSGNGIPTISCLFARTDTNLVRVDTCFQKIIDRYILRTGVNVSFDTDGIDDECYGATVSDRGTAVDVLTRHKELLNFQILDGDPIKIVRRPISSDLVIDLEVAEADVVRGNGAPAVPSTRVNPSQLPIGINLTYPDVDVDFDDRTQPALHEGTAASTVISSAQTIFSTDSTTARRMAFEMLYRLRAKALGMPFELDNVVTEVSDVIRLTSNEGDIYTLLTDETTYTKTRSTMVRALALLTEAGVNIDGGDGLAGGISGRRLWPEECVQYDMIPTSGRLWSNYNSEINYDSNPPARRIGTLKHAAIASSNIGRMFEDNSYVYWLDSSELTIYRCRKNASNIPISIQTLQIPAFTAGGGYSSSRGTYPSVLKDGKLYVAWDGTNGVSSNNFKLVVVDLTAWDASVYTTYDWWTNIGNINVDDPAVYGLAITDNGTIVISATIGTPVGRLYCSTTGSPGSWSTVDLTVKPGFGTSSVNWAYFTEIDPAGFGVAHRTHKIVVVDCSGSPSASVVDLTSQDANIVCISQRSLQQDIFCSPAHLFVPCNYTRNNTTDQAEREYLARLDHGTLTAAGGQFIGELIYAEHELFVYNGRYFDGSLYLAMLGEAYDGRVLIVAEDLSSGTLYPVPGVSFPDNDDFSSALAIDLSGPQSGNLFYGSTQASEPLPSWAASGSFTWTRNAGHSVWYSFYAPATTTYNIVVADHWGGDSHSVQVYTGTDIASIVEVDSQIALFTNNHAPPSTTLSFAATAGVTYMVSIRHDFTGAFGGFAGNSPFKGIPDAERLGEYTITIS